MLSQLVDLFKLRIGMLMAVTALAGYAITPGTRLNALQLILLAILVLMASASSGAFNQYIERDLDARMQRTAARPFVTGFFMHGWLWLTVIWLLLLVAVVGALYAFNGAAALYLLLGALTYGVVYTVWLKPRTAWNIVIGGLAGSFAVLAGAAAANPQLGPEAICLAIVLFLWTPPHFWSLAIALREEYAEAGVPMLPVVVGDARSARIILFSTLLLVAVSSTPVFFGLGWIYLSCALAGGLNFLYRNLRLVQKPEPREAIKNFLASILQLSLLLIGAIVDAAL
ncbi:MAG: heme o synthase [Pseudomonadales bacterium]